MSKRSTIGLLFLVAAIATLWFLWPTDENRIRKLFREGAKAVEAGDIEVVIVKVSFNYRDDYGMTYLYLRETLKREFQRLSGISVEYENLKVRVSENTATAELDIRVIATSGSETGYIIGDVRTPVHLRFILEKERAKWQIVKAEGFERPYGMRSSVR
jgi:hypothetical protein